MGNIIPVTAYLCYDLFFTELLHSEEVTAEDVLIAYMWKAIEVHDKYNCATEFFVEAFDEAKKLDETWHGKQKPPLFGVPFSVKSNFQMKGYDCTLGLAKYLFLPADEDCSFVSHLRSLGAVPFVYTNVPQGLLSFVCSNAIYGTTKNPFNVERTPGGSSGGEAVLCATGGSAFGIGSDLAGSLRIPAAMCSLITLKPTEGNFAIYFCTRFSVTGSYSGAPGRGRMACSYGYFTRNIEEQKFLLKLTFGYETYIKMVPKMVPICFNEKRFDDTTKRPLRIGYYTDDGYLPPIPACSRVVKDTVPKLEDLGHKLIPFEVPSAQKAATLFFKNIMPDQGQLVNELYSGEPLSPYLKLFALSLRVPLWIRWLVGWMLKWISPQLSTMFLAYMRNLSDLRKTQHATDEYKEEFIKKWMALKLDAIICPSFPVPAVPHEFPSRMSFCGFSTGIYNLLDFPAGVVPTGFVTESDDSAIEQETQWPTGNNIALKVMREASKNSAGLPLSIQVVGLPFQEEECLGVMKIIEEIWSTKNK
uniref:Amidase domain-containing protein n=1 Tax=Syphacia muris TaxID=451379 RepID=A0A0N5ANS2_9BILA